jgi:hypothetical protein
VAFDPDGADLEDFNANILEDVADPDQAGLSRSSPRVWEFQVRLPNTPCENCTLQVIQAMHGDDINPVSDPAPLSTYYACADLRLVAPGTLPAGAGGTGSSGSSTSSGAGAGGASGGGTSSAAGSGGAGLVAAAPEADEEDEPGCAFSAARPLSARGSVFSSLLLLGLLGARRRASRRDRA